MYCLYCGSAIDPDAQFCASCGKKQNVIETSAPPPTAPPVLTPKKSRVHIWVMAFLVLFGASLLFLILSSSDKSPGQQQQKSSVVQPQGDEHEQQPSASKPRDDEFQQRVGELTKAGVSRADAEKAVHMQMRHEAEAEGAKEPAHIQPPTFRVYKSKTDVAVAYIVPINTTEGQLKNLVWYFQKQVRASQFASIGITKPTSKNWDQLNYRAGILLVYRSEKCANEAFVTDAQLEQGYHGPCGDGEHQDAEYQWGFPPGNVNGFFDEGSVKGENGDLWPVFNTKAQ
jgi:hypothetical protein